MILIRAIDVLRFKEDSVQREGPAQRGFTVYNTYGRTRVLMLLPPVECTNNTNTLEKKSLAYAYDLL